MSNLVLRKRRNTTVELSGITINKGDIWIDTTKNTVVVGDGTIAGGVPLAKEVHTHADATTGTPGFMSAADKVKLNNLSEVGAIQTIESDGLVVGPESTLNFSANFDLVDDTGDSRINVDIGADFQAQINSDIVALILALGE